MEKFTKLWYLEQFNLFRKLTKEEMSFLESVLIMRNVSKNILIHFPDMEKKYVYFLKKGAVKIVHTDKEGNEFIKYLLKPGDIFGELALLGIPENREDYAVTLEECLICFMDMEIIRQLMQQNRTLDRQVRKLIGLRIRKVENRLTNLIFKDSRERIKDFLLEFAREFGEPLEEGYQVRNFLTHDDIAKLTATTRQTVTSTLNEFKLLGYIQYNTHELIVKKTLSSPVTHRHR